MLLLGIETSCDETSAAVVEDGTKVRSCVISSSKDAFTKMGGVLPENAARKQLESMQPVLELALKEAGISMNDVDAIAVTYGPGLLGSLLVGTSAARVLSAVFKKPLIPAHHTLGHLSSVWLDTEEAPRFPALALSVSGGHSDLWYRRSHTEGTLVGTTRDDAAGEAFDKGAVQLGLPYPGGPALAKLAQGGNEKQHEFPLPLKKENTLDFSFSGLKTSLKYLLRDLGSPTDTSVLKDIAASYQYAICLHLADRVKAALERYPDASEVHVVGGVSANTRLREMLTDLDVPVRFPQKLLYCTDNAAMIASAGYFLWDAQKKKAARPFVTSATTNIE